MANRTIVHLLHGYCGKHPKLRDEHLHYIQHAYNHSKHSSTQVSPFEACFSYFPKSPLDFIFGKYIAVDGHSDVDKAKHFIEQIQLTSKSIKATIENQGHAQSKT